jgi:hypothetical protein
MAPCSFGSSGKFLFLDSAARRLSPNNSSQRSCHGVRWLDTALDPSGTVSRGAKPSGIFPGSRAHGGTSDRDGPWARSVGGAARPAEFDG